MGSKDGQRQEGQGSCLRRARPVSVPGYQTHLRILKLLGLPEKATMGDMERAVAKILQERNERSPAELRRELRRLRKEEAMLRKKVVDLEVEARAARAAARRSAENAEFAMEHARKYVRKYGRLEEDDG